MTGDQAKATPSDEVERALKVARAREFIERLMGPELDEIVTAIQAEAEKRGARESKDERDELRRRYDEQVKLLRAAQQAIRRDGWEEGETLDQFTERLDHYIADLDTEAEIAAEVDR